MNIVDKQGRIQIASPASEWMHLELGRTTDQTLPSSVVTATEWQVVTAARGLVVGDWWSASTNPSRITVPTGWGGMYFAQVNLNFAASSAGTNRAVNLIINSAAAPNISNYTHIRTDAGAVRMSAGGTFWLNSGDYVEGAAYQNSGSTLAITSNISNFRISRLPLGVPMGTSSAELVYVEADKDGDGDKDALTAAAWENSTKSGSGTINWNTAFGVPAGAKAVVAYATGSLSASGASVSFKAKSTATNYSGVLISQVSGAWVRDELTIPVAADGTSYYNFSTTWTNFYLRVLGWFVERPRQT